MAGMQVGSRRTETKDLNSSSVSPSALVSFPSLSVTWLLYPFVFENMATGAYKFHTFELSWMPRSSPAQDRTPSYPGRCSF